MNHLDPNECEEIEIVKVGLSPAAVASLVVLATFVALAAPAAGSSIDEIEVRVRQIYFEGYPVTASGPLESAVVERLGEMLQDSAEEEYWSNIVLALGASENAAAYRHLADFAASRLQGEASSGQYQARVALPVALGHLANSHPPALGLVEEMARDTRAEPGWKFQSLDGAALAVSLRRSAITGLAVSGRPEAAAALSQLKAEARAAQRAATAPGRAARDADELLLHIEFARSIHERVASNGVASVLDRAPMAK